MSSIAIIGTQWGDEGKAKIVDLLAGSADAVVRTSGGNNAGHSVVVAGMKYPLDSLWNIVSTCARYSWKWYGAESTRTP